MLIVRIVISFVIGEERRLRTGKCLSLVTQKLRSEEHTSELQSQSNLVCRLLLEKKKTPGRAGGRQLTCGGLEDRPPGGARRGRSRRRMPQAASGGRWRAFVRWRFRSAVACAVRP